MLDVVQHGRTGRTAEVAEMAATAAEREAWMDGFELGARVENRHARQALATAVLAVLGKDRGDGLIDLGALGAWYAGADGEVATLAVDTRGHVWDGLGHTQPLETCRCNAGWEA